jgi:hypothetical protein
MFCVKGFAAGPNVRRYFGSVAVATGVTATAARIAAAKRAGSNVGQPTFDTEELQKESLIREIDREPIDDGGCQFSLWIKVPSTDLLPAISSRRCFFRCFMQKNPVRFTIPEHRAASSAVEQAGL